VSAAARIAAAFAPLLFMTDALHAQQLSPLRVATLMAEAPQISEVALSPRGSVERNQSTSELLLQPTDAGAAARVITTVDSAARFAQRWHPKRSVLTYFDKARNLVQYDVATGAGSPVVINSPAQSRIGGDYRWSPQGNFIAFTAAAAPGNGLDPKRGISVSKQWRPATGAPKSLFVLNVATGVVEQPKAAPANIVSFDWAPSENELVVAATEDAEGIPFIRTDLYIVPRVDGTTRTLVSRPGLDGFPSWSPNGKWIAFASHFGDPTYYVGELAIVPASGGDVLRLGNAEGPKLQPETPGFWSRDGSSYYFNASHHMTNQLIRAEIAARRLTPMNTDETRFDASFSASGDASTLAFSRETLIQPPELFVQTLPRGKPRQLTHLSESYPLTSLARMDTVSWPSSDGKFTIHGVLLRPATLSGPAPLLVYVSGGPSMIRRGFSQDGRGGAMLPLAALGYAVLAPNTRGRGGYGESFQRGIRDGRSAGQLPYQDVMDGVNQLVASGIADSKSLGIYGHSYGGYLTAYAITQTNAFKAAVMVEGPVERVVGGLVNAAPGTDWALLMQDLVGIRDRYREPDLTTITAESPLLHADRVKTPTLMLYGAKSMAEAHGIPFFGALQRFGISSELVIYDEGHVFERPAAQADSTLRTIEWMRRWVH
jgi:dipeptidyl aminopeptidase/acylaminoacyl peptidase